MTQLPPFQPPGHCIIYTLKEKCNYVRSLKSIRLGSGKPAVNRCSYDIGGEVERLTVDADDFDHCEGEEGQRCHVHFHEDGRHQENNQDDDHTAEDS